MKLKSLATGEVDTGIEEIETAEKDPEVAELEATANAEVSLDFVDLELPDGTLAFLMIDSNSLISQQKSGKNIYVLNIDLIGDLEDSGWNAVDLIGEIDTHGNLVESYLNSAGIGGSSRRYARGTCTLSPCTHLHYQWMNWRLN